MADRNTVSEARLQRCIRRPAQATVSSLSGFVAEAGAVLVFAAALLPTNTSTRPADARNR